MGDSTHLGLSAHNDGCDQTSFCAHSNAHINVVVPGGSHFRTRSKTGIGPTYNTIISIKTEQAQGYIIQSSASRTGIELYNYYLGHKEMQVQYGKNTPNSFRTTGLAIRVKK